MQTMSGPSEWVPSDELIEQVVLLPDCRDVLKAAVASGELVPHDEKMKWMHMASQQSHELFAARAVVEAARNYWHQLNDKGCGPDQINALRDTVVAYVEKDNKELRAVLKETVDVLYDACWQGTGNEPLKKPGWHNFLSTYEEADELIPRVRAVLGWCEECDGSGVVRCDSPEEPGCRYPYHKCSKCAGKGYVA